MAVTVNGEKIDEKLIEKEVSRLRPDYERAFAEQPKDEREQQLKEWSTENVIESTLLQQHAAETVEVTDEQVEKALEELTEKFKKQGGNPDDIKEEGYEEMRGRLRNQLQVQKLLDQIYAEVPKLTDEEIEQYYEENKERYRSPEQVRVSHMVKHPGWQASEDEALEIMKKAKAELDAGKSFEEVATSYSDCPDRGGDLGYITRGQMVEEFEDVAFKMTPGQVSDIFQTRFGWHIATVKDRKPSTVPPLSEIKKRVLEELETNRKTEALENYIDSLKEKASIERK